jgi:hypothetical protein
MVGENGKYGYLKELFCLYIRNYSNLVYERIDVLVHVRG